VPFSAVRVSPTRGLPEIVGGVVAWGGAAVVADPLPATAASASTAPASAAANVDPRFVCLLPMSFLPRYVFGLYRL